MRYLALLAFLVGCAESSPAGPPKQPEATVVGGSDPMACKLDADLVACHCTIPEYSADAIAEMGTRCNFLRAIAGTLY